MEDVKQQDKLSILNLIVLILSIYVLISLLIDTFIALPVELSRLFNIIDNTICIFFLIEFFIRFFKSNNKLQFMKLGWIDLIASIPLFGFLRYGRIFRVIRIIRILRAFKTSKEVIDHIYKDKINGTFATVFIIAILTILFSAISILQVETDPNSNIKTAEDAIWWAYTTITTVGYGDKYPVTTEGRIIAMILMTVGVGTFGTITAFVSSLFTKNKQ